MMAEKYRQGFNTFNDWASGLARNLLNDRDLESKCMHLFYENVKSHNGKPKILMKVIYKIQKDPNSLRFSALDKENRFAAIDKILKECSSSSSITAKVAVEMNSLPPTEDERWDRCDKILSLNLPNVICRDFRLFPPLKTMKLKDVEYLCSCIEKFPLQAMNAIWGGKYWLQHFVTGVLNLPPKSWPEFSHTLSVLIDLNSPYNVHDLFRAGMALCAANPENWSLLSSVVTLMTSDTAEKVTDPIAFNKNRAYLTDSLKRLNKEELDALLKKYLNADEGGKKAIVDEKILSTSLTVLHI